MENTSYNKSSLIIKFIVTISVVEMRKLRWILNIARKNQLKNKYIYNRLGVMAISGKLRTNHLI